MATQVVARAEANDHQLEKFRDVFAQDMIWAAQTMGRKRLPSIEMMIFQESLIARGLKEFPDEEDQMPRECSVSMGYSAVLAAECLEMIDDILENVIHNNYLVCSPMIFMFVED